MRIECDDRVCRRTVFRQDFIDVKRVDPSLFCIPNIYDVSVQISRQVQVLCFGIEYDHSRSVCPLVEKQTFQEERFTTTRFTDDHSVTVLIQVPSLPYIEDKGIMIALVLSEHNATFHAIIDILREDIKTCKPIRFDGNGYSDEWKAEAARRGLDVETSCPVIFERYLDPESIAMFESLGVMTKKELEARNEVKWETYTKKIQIEARVLGDLSMNHIIPVATAYQSQLLKNVEKMRAIFPAMKADKLSARNLKLIEEIAERTAAIETKVEELVAARKVANKIEDEHQKAIAYHDTIAPMFDIIRRQIDKLELIVDDALWPLPKYRELLFIR